jgi:hypothetical protein
MGIGMFLEVVYETGRMSVMEVDSVEEGMEGLRVHHQKALSGQPGGPLGQPAERVAAVYQYDKHPNNYNDEQTLSAEVATKTISELIKDSAEDGVISIDQLALSVRGLSHPMNPTEDIQGFASRYKMKESKKLDLKFLEGSDS